MHIPTPLASFVLTTILILSAPMGFAEEPGVYITDHGHCAPEGIALGGYDPVSYFEDGPIPGNPQITLAYQELTYQFSNEENKARFESEPENFLPKYRGWCSATLAMGRLACPDFTNYKIENGQLLLFERIGFSNGLDMWNADPIANSKNANNHFQRLLQQAKDHLKRSE